MGCRSPTRPIQPIEGRLGPLLCIADAVGSDLGRVNILLRNTTRRTSPDGPGILRGGRG